MAFRRRHRGFRRRSTPKDWLVNQTYWNSALSVTTAGAFELCGSSTTNESIDPISITRFTALAVRGDIYIDFSPMFTGNGAGSAIFVAFGVYKTLMGSGGGAGLNPSTAGDAPNDQWMWLYHNLFFLTANAANTQFYATGMQPRIPVDIRVKRTIHGGESLQFCWSAFLYSGTSQGAATAGARCFSFLRTLVTKVA